MIGASILNSSQKSHGPKSNKFSKKNFKHNTAQQANTNSAPTAATSASVVSNSGYAALLAQSINSDKMTEDQRKIMQDYQFYETVKRARHSKNSQNYLAYNIDILKHSSDLFLQISLFAANLVAFMFSLVVLDE